MITSLFSSSYHSAFFFFFCILLFTFFKASTAATFTLINKCDYTIWPGTLSSTPSTTLDSTGFELLTGASRSFVVSPGWSGRFWARTGCNFDPNTGTGTCRTGDCGSGQITCHGGAIPPATLAEFTIGSGSSQDFYDVSLVDGYNLPIMVDVIGGTGSCESTGCGVDVNQYCPSELRTANGEGCKSACEGLGGDEYCCRGVYGSGPDTCKPTVYSELFKLHCPKAYSYAYDDATSTFTCSGATDYKITFCPNNLKSVDNYSSPPPPPPPLQPDHHHHGSDNVATPVNQVSDDGSGGGGASGSGNENGPGMEVTGGADSDDWLSNLFSGDGNSFRIHSATSWKLKLAEAATSIASLFVFQAAAAIWL